jgi:hypothetical protein
MGPSSHSVAQANHYGSSSRSVAQAALNPDVFLGDGHASRPCESCVSPVSKAVGTSPRIRALSPRGQLRVDEIVLLARNHSEACVQWR